MQNCAESVKRERKKVRILLRISHIHWLTAGFLFLVDQSFKFLFYRRDIVAEKITLIKGLLYAVPASRNAGVAFGLLKKYGQFLTIPAFLAIFFVLLVYFKTDEEENLIRWGLLLILSGALSNLVDRIIYHSVIDYLLLRYFPYFFNLADLCILLGMGMIATRLLGKSSQKS